MVLLPWRYVGSFGTKEWSFAKFSYRQNYPRTQSCRWNALPDALSAEANACKDGAQLTVSLGIKQIVLETCYLNFVNLWKRRDNQCSEIMGAIQQVKTLSSTLSPSTMSQGKPIMLQTYVLYNQIM
ncbi:hypothetical protein ACQ4PT_006707 [Festuca glaucescens]